MDPPTCHILLFYSLEQIYVEDDAQHALQYTDLGTET